MEVGKAIERLLRQVDNLKKRVFGPRRDIFAHSLGWRVPEVPHEVVPDVAATAIDVQIAQRLLTAYSKCQSIKSATPLEATGDIWSVIRKQQATFLRLLEGGDPARLAEYLCNMSRQDATTGTVQGDKEYARIRSSARYRRFVAQMAKDKLVSLAEAVGAIPCENPEQGPWGENILLDANVLVESISRILGIDIAPPPIDGGLLKLRTTRGLFNERDLNAIFTAWNLRQLLGCHSSAIAEIGGGSGRVAFWSQQFGFRSYTIIDLPHINVVQGYYLLKSLPNANVSLYGEVELSNFTDRITILPCSCLSEIPAGSFDMILNQDSFPEINRETVLQYLVWIARASRQWFYSINHESRPPSTVGEAQLNVPELIREIGGFHRVSRVPYWLRKGYVSELYSVEKRS